MTFDNIKEMQIGSKKVKEAWLNGMQVYPSAKKIMDSLVCWYDPGKQQCTNESMAANPVLADLSGNGHDIECFNFGWAGMSGIGGYEVEYDKAGGTYSTVNGNIVTVDGTALDKSNWFWPTNAPYSGKPFKVNVTVEIADSNTDADNCLIFQFYLLLHHQSLGLQVFLVLLVHLVCL